MTPTISENTALWNRTLVKIEARLTDKRIYDSFFRSTVIDRIEGDVVYVVANSALSKEILSKEPYKTIIQDCLSEASGTEFRVTFISSSEATKKPEKIEIESKPSFFEDTKLNKNHTLDNFVVGDSNREAYQASLMISKNPGNLYNPLLIYSESGLGKTHLIHALGNAIVEASPKSRVLCITASEFVDEYVKFATGNREDQSLVQFFRQDVDVLLIDDIQLITGKKGTMEMFFTVFQTLYSQGKQIVITSDQHPNYLNGLDERLRTRFNQGLSLSMTPPDKITSQEILKKKIEANGLDTSMFDDGVISLLAANFSNNVRELEGALNRLLFYAITMKQAKHITVDVASEAIASLVPPDKSKGGLNDKRIISVVADYYSLTPSQVTGGLRTSQIAMARHIAMYLMRQLLDMSLNEIGSAFGGKDHSTVLSAIKKVEKALIDDAGMSTAISELKQRLEQ